MGLKLQMQTKFASAIFQFGKSFVQVNHTEKSTTTGQTVKVQLSGLLSPDLSGSTLFPNSAYFVFGAL